MTSLRVLLAVAEHGTASGAAAAVNLTQSAVSKHLRALEETMGATFFTRGSRGLVPTEAGRIYIKHARTALAELEKLDPSEPDWPRRAAECHRVLGQAKAQVEALGRAAERYMVQGLVPKAIATCKVILSIDPKHTETQQRLAALHGSPPARPAFESPLKRNPVQTRQPPPLEARSPSPPAPAPVLAPPPRAPTGATTRSRTCGTAAAG